MAEQFEASEGLRLKLEGDLVFGNVMSIRQRIERQIVAGVKEVRIDLSEVGRVDSSALSLWLCFQRRADEFGLKLIAENVPAELKSIAQLVGLEQSALLVE